METTKVFMKGRSQAVHIPKKYRFNSAKVEIRRHGSGILLSPIINKEALQAFLDLPYCPDFSVDRSAAQEIQLREWFE